VIQPSLPWLLIVGELCAVPEITGARRFGHRNGPVAGVQPMLGDRNSRIAEGVPQITVRWPFGLSVAEMVRCASAQLCPPLAQRAPPWIAIPKSWGQLSVTRFWNNGYGYACSQCARSGLLKGLLEKSSVN
jgi:hypothetical protein